MRVVFGGSFDPVHVGHLAMADAVQREIAPRALLWVPSGHAPHKPERAPAPAAARLEWLHRVVDPRPGERVLAVETERPAPSYTVDTLEALHAEAPDDPLAFLAGGDSLGHLATWRALPRLFALAEWLFAPRPGWGAAELEAFRAGLDADLRAAFRARMLDMDEVDVSSSGIRAALRAGGTPHGLPAGVLESIRAHGCYQSA